MPRTAPLACPAGLCAAAAPPPPPHLCCLPACAAAASQGPPAAPSGPPPACVGRGGGQVCVVVGGTGAPCRQGRLGCALKTADMDGVVGARAPRAGEAARAALKQQKCPQPLACCAWRHVRRRGAMCPGDIYTPSSAKNHTHSRGPPHLLQQAALLLLQLRLLLLQGEAQQLACRSEGWSSVWMRVSECECICVCVS